jgi:hypothetical protein
MVHPLLLLFQWSYQALPLVLRVPAVGDYLQVLLIAVKQAHRPPEGRVQTAATAAQPREAQDELAVALP